MRRSWFALVLPALLTAQSPQRRVGDWIVKGAETVDTASIVLAGNLIIESTGSLSLNNVTLTIEAAATPWKIDARAGSTLTIAYSTVTGAGYGFVVDGARFTLRGSRVDGLADTGLELRNTTGALIEQSQFPGGAGSLVCLTKSQEAVLRGNRFADESPLANQGGVRLLESHSNEISSNTFHRTAVHGGLSHANKLTGNDVLLAGDGPGFTFFTSGYNEVSRNKFTQEVPGLAACFAVRINNSPWPNYILDNTVTGNRYAFLVSYSDQTVVAGNVIKGMTDTHTGAVHVIRSRGTQILNNTITGSEGSGIMIFGGSGNAVRSNRVADSASGVALFYSDGNNVTGNRLERNTENLTALDARRNMFESNDLFRGSRQGRDTNANTWRDNYFDAGGPVIPPSGYDGAPRSVQGSLAASPVPAVEVRIPSVTTPPSVTIEKDTLWENCERDFHMIHVGAGAKLTVRNCTLRASYPGFAGFLGSGPDGSLEILNSVVLDGPNSPLYPGVGAGSKLVIRDSRFRGLSGWAGGLGLDTDNAVIENSEFADGYTGIIANGTGGHRIVNNRFLRNIDGIYGDGKDLVVEGNLFSGNLMGGFGGTSARLTGNHFEHGFFAAGASKGVQIRDNVFFHNSSAVGVSAGAVLSGNAFIGNGSWNWARYGGYAVGGALARARWWEDGRGNHWSDYRGLDANKDGVGDTPFDTFEGVFDRYPLMNPPATACRPVLDRAEAWLPADGGGVQIGTGVTGDCVNAVAVQDDWILTSGGGATVTVSAGANPGRTFRAGTITVAGRLLRVFQPPAGCSYTLDTTRVTAVREANALRVKVTAPAGCPWSVSGIAWWMMAGAGTDSGVGSGEVMIPIPENRSESRGVALTVAGQSVDLTQVAAGPVFAVITMANAASGVYEGGFAPGSLLSIYGWRLGPPDGAQASVPTKGLGGARVFFDQTEGFLIYAGWNQLNVLVPNGLTAGASVLVRPEYGPSPGQKIHIAVAAAAPGIFTLDGSGTGQIVAVNQDLSFNSTKTPAGRDTIVTFFATGFGKTDPPMQDGVHPTPPVFPRPTLPLYVYLGGREVPASHVLFTGAILTGVLQVNVRIPADAPTGDQVPVTLRFDTGQEGVNSQPAIWLAIR